MADDGLKSQSGDQNDLVNVSSEIIHDLKNSNSASASDAAESTSTSERPENSKEVNLPISSSSNESVPNEDSSSAVVLDKKIMCPTCALNASDKSGLSTTETDSELFSELCELAVGEARNSTQLMSECTVVEKPKQSFLEFLPATSISRIGRLLTREDFAKKFPNCCVHIYSIYIQEMEERDRRDKMEREASEDGSSSLKLLSTSTYLTSFAEVSSPMESASCSNTEEEIAIRSAESKESTPGYQQSENKGQDDSNSLINENKSISDRIENSTETINFPASCSSESNSNQDLVLPVTHKMITCVSCAGNSPSDEPNIVVMETNPDLITKLFDSACGVFIHSAQMTSRFTVGAKPKESILEFLPAVSRSRIGRLTEEDFVKNFPNCCDHVYSAYLHEMEFIDASVKNQMKHEASNDGSSSQHSKSSPAIPRSSEGDSSPMKSASVSNIEDKTVQSAEPAELTPGPAIPRSSEGISSSMKSASVSNIADETVQSAEPAKLAPGLQQPESKNKDKEQDPNQED